MLQISVMKDEALVQTAYQYFPKGIDNSLQHDAYISSREFLLLSKKCHKAFERMEEGVYNPFYQHIINIDKHKDFHNATHFSFNDRCHNLQLAELVGNKLFSICLNISILVPYYTTYVLETNVSYLLTILDYHKFLSRQEI